MSIVHPVKVKNGKLPTHPGVYLFKDQKGRVVYVGKATNLKSRVSSYWNTSDGRGLNTGWPRITDAIHSPIRANRRMNAGRAIEEMLHEVRRIDWITTDSVIEALILEANLIKKYQPRYNVREKDDKSFLYVVITKDTFPKVQLVRRNELRQFGVRPKGRQLPSFRLDSSEHRAVFGPYTSASALRAALDLMRKWFAWSTCKAGQSRSCFDYHIGRCPGVCVGAISRREYMKNIRNVILMLEGKKGRVISNVEREMQRAAQDERFEEAEKLKRKLFALQHIRDVAVIAHDTNLHEFKKRIATNTINILGRIEGYDISNISGTSAVGSMVVFKNGEPRKSEYKRFRIKTVRGINDVAMMREVLTRRFRHSERSEESRESKDGILRSPRGSLRMTSIGWPLPDLLVIDGGWGQVNAAQEIVGERGLRIPIVGIAKGFKRKQDRPIFDKNNPEIMRIVENYKDLLLQVRDEAHRFAVAYHRKVRSKINI